MRTKHEKTEVIWDKNGKSIFEKFAVGLEDFTKTGTPPAYGDQDVQYCLELQQERLKNRNLTLHYDITPRGMFADGGGLNKSWKDDRYISTMEYRTCELNRTIYRGGKKIYDKTQDRILYEIITNVHNQELVGNDLHTCPNCGAVSKIAELQNGCTYCGTVFAMRDLFPKVTNYYHLEDYSGTEQELEGDIRKSIIPWILVCSIGYIIYFLKNPSVEGVWIVSVIQGILAGSLCGSIIGYFGWAMRKLAGVLKGAGKAVPMLLNVSGSAKKFTTEMQKYSPEFSYEYFSSKAVSLLKMILFAENPDELAIYDGDPLGTRFANIIDSSYRAATALKQFQIQDDVCMVVADVYMEDLYIKGNRIAKRDTMYRMFLRKNIRRAFNTCFSIKAIQCSSCGGSFDATKEKTCPNCGTKYTAGDDDWVVTKIRKG